MEFRGKYRAGAGNELIKKYNSALPWSSGVSRLCNWKPILSSFLSHLRTGV